MSPTISHKKIDMTMIAPVKVAPSSIELASGCSRAKRSSHEFLSNMLVSFAVKVSSCGCTAPVVGGCRTYTAEQF